MDARTRNTLKVILKYRGVEDTEFEEIRNIKNDLNISAYEAGPILIILSQKARILEGEIDKLMTFAGGVGKESGVIIIVQNRPPDSVTNRIRTLISNPDHPLIQLFELGHLQFDISHHRRVPKHTILPKDEVPALMEKYHINDLKHLPKLDSQDPMARWIGARPGDIIEITGLCETSGDNRRYRLCVANATEA